LTENRRDAPTYWVDSGSGPGWDVPAEQLDETPAPRSFPRLSKLRGILPAIPGPVLPTLTGPAVPMEHDDDHDDDPAPDCPVPPHVEVDALNTILERHVTGADGICFCGERAGEFTGRCSIGRRAAKRLTELGFQGYEVPTPPSGRPPAPLDDGR
jgi:hypothetical protein